MRVNKSWYIINAILIISMIALLGLGIFMALRASSNSFTIIGIAISICGLVGTVGGIVQRKSVRNRDTN